MAFDRPSPLSAFGINPSDTDLRLGRIRIGEVRGLRARCQPSRVSEAGRSYDAVALQKTLLASVFHLPRDDADPIVENEEWLYAKDWPDPSPEA